MSKASENKTQPVDDQAEAVLGSEERPLIIKQVYDLREVNTCSEAPVCGELSVEEELEHKARNIGYLAEILAGHLLQNPQLRVILKNDIFYPGAKIDGKTQGAWLAQQCFTFAEEFQGGMKDMVKAYVALHTPAQPVTPAAGETKYREPSEGENKEAVA